jgi:hypothetical protein
MKKYIIKFGFLAAMVSSVSVVNSCSNEFVNTDFFQSVQQGPLNSIEELESFVRGQYSTMRATTYYGCDFLMIPEVRSDNMYSDFANGAGYYQTVASYSMTSTDAYASGTYLAMYTTIAKANIVINNVPSKALSWKASQDPVVIQNKSNYLQGQSYAARALALFDLLRLFGQEYSGGTLGVVVPTKYDPTGNQARLSVSATRAQIEADFDKALVLMNTASLNAYSDKTSLNTLSVKALMSRYYLYKGDFARVRSLVSDIVAANKYAVVAAPDYSRSFTQANSATNSIFELAIGTINDLGTTSVAYKLNVAPAGYGNMKVLPALRSSYIADDVRLAGISPANVLNGKYVGTADNVHLIRYEEVLLNGAEAELNPGGTLSKALTYFNLIQAKRGVATGALAPAVVLTLNNVYTERKKELVGEGFGYWDLLRLGKSITQRSSSGVAGTVRLIGDNLLAFPIPRNELNVPGTLVLPNPGFGN